MASSTLKTALQKILGTPPIAFYPALAMHIGVSNSFCWQQLNYWITNENKSVGKIFDGHKWIYNTYAQWHEQLPFLSERTIRRSLQELEKMGLVLSRMEGKLKYYSIDYDVLVTILAGDKTYQDDPSQIGQHLEPKSPDNQVISMVSEDDGQNGQDEDDGGQIGQVRWPNWTGKVAKLDSSYIDTKTTQRLPERDARARATPSLSEDKISKKAEEAFPLDENWVLLDDWREKALTLGLFNEEIDLAQKKFKSHYLCSTTFARKFTTKGWLERWEIWCLGDLQRKGRAAVTNTENTVSETSQQHPKQSSNPRIQQWYDLQPKLRDKIGEANHKSWIERHLELIAAEGKVIFKATSAFTRDWITRTFMDDIKAILAEIDPRLGKEWNIEFMIE